MRDLASGRSRGCVLVVAVGIFLTGLLAIPARSVAADEPQPDPAGIATGDKSNAVDAAGYAFQFGAVAVNAAPANLGGTPTLNRFLLGSGQWGFLGGRGFFLTGPAYDAGSNVLTLFEVVFMETAGYIIVGAICERITFGAFILCELFVGAILYPVFGCWVWGGGWLSQLGSSMGL